MQAFLSDETSAASDEALRALVAEVVAAMRPIPDPHDAAVAKLMGTTVDSLDRRTRLDLAIRHLVMVLHDIALENALDPDTVVALYGIGTADGEPELDPASREQVLRIMRDRKGGRPELR